MSRTLSDEDIEALAVAMIRQLKSLGLSEVRRIRRRLESLGDEMLALPGAYEDRPDGTRRLRYVYLMRCTGCGRHKIGMSFDVCSRVAEVQCECHTWEPIEIRGVAPGGRDLEFRLHQQYAAKRVWREWFDLDADDVTAIMERPLWRDWVD